MVVQSKIKTKQNSLRIIVLSTTGLVLLLTNKIAIASAAVTISIAGGGYLGVHYLAPQSDTSQSQTAASPINNQSEKVPLVASELVASKKNPPKNSSPNNIKAKVKAPASSGNTNTPPPSASPPPPPAPNTTNCLPPNPSIYATYYINLTTSEYLQTNSYADTNKLYAGLQFAGLLNKINSKQYTVLAMDDSAWDYLTPSQQTWMNASPSNMASVLGWQIITSCITFDGINPIKDMVNGATRTVNTLNGPVVYTQVNNGQGTFDNATVAMWDWFTSNGAVTLAGFVNPPTSH